MLKNNYRRDCSNAEALFKGLLDEVAYAQLQKMHTYVIQERTELFYFSFRTRIWSRTWQLASLQLGS